LPGGKRKRVWLTTPVVTASNTQTAPALDGLFLLPVH